MSNGFKVSRRRREKFMMLYYDVLNSDIMNKTKLLVPLVILRFARWEEKTAFPIIEMLAKVS